MLSLKLSVGALSQDGTSILLRDTTGVYNAGVNPGGYGAPNPTVEDAALAILLYSVYGGQKNQINFLSGPEEMITGVTFTALTLGITTDQSKPYLIPDGVNVFNYLVGYNLTGAVTADGYVIDTSAADVPDGLGYVAFSSNNLKVYKIVAQDNDSITLDEIPEIAEGDTLVGFYSTDGYTLVDTYINRLVDKKVVGTTPCDDPVQLMEDVMNILAAASRFNQQDYLGANTLITTLNKKYEYVSRRVQH